MADSCIKTVPVRYGKWLQQPPDTVDSFWVISDYEIKVLYDEREPSINLYSCNWLRRPLENYPKIYRPLCFLR